MIDYFFLYRYVPSLPREAFCESDNSLSQSLRCLERIGFNEKVGACRSKLTFILQSSNSSKLFSLEIQSESSLIDPVLLQEET
jgi:hypothetical protein